MLARAVEGRKEASGFQHIVNAQIAPAKLRWVALAEALGAVRVAHQRIALGVDPVIKATVHRVVEHEVGEVVRRNKVVDSNYINIPRRTASR